MKLLQNVLIIIAVAIAITLPVSQAAAEGANLVVTYTYSPNNSLKNRVRMVSFSSPFKTRAACERARIKVFDNPRGLQQFKNGRVQDQTLPGNTSFARPIISIAFICLNQ